MSAVNRPQPPTRYFTIVQSLPFALIIAASCGDDSTVVTDVAPPPDASSHDGSGDGETDGGCSHETCPDGCCAAGECVGPSDFACAAAGAACVDCTAIGQACDLDAMQCCTPGTCGSLLVRRGDIIVGGAPAASFGEALYPSQSFLTFFSTIAQDTGVLSPYFGDNLGTWDDTTAATGRRTIWSSVEIVASDGIRSAPVDGLEIVLRPTDAMRERSDIDAMTDRFLQSDAPIAWPFPGLFLRWLQWGQDNIEWFAPPIPAHWNALYGLDLTALEPLVAMQTTAQMAPATYTDIDSPAFWLRDMSPSSRVAWAIIWGMRAGEGEDVRGLFLNNLAAVAAVDSIAPGQLAWWLVDQRLARPITSNVAVAVSLREAGTALWEDAVTAPAPVVLDMKVDIAGALPGATVQIRCNDGAPVVQSSVIDLPSTVLAPGICVYEEPQWLSPVVEVVWEGKTVATGRAIAAVTPSTVDVEVGDIIMFGSPALTPRSATYQTQAYLSFVQASGTQVALYDPFWGPGLGTWDDSTSELGQRAFWGHVELAQAQGPYPVKDGFDLVVLRPTVLMHSAVDMGAASNRVLTGSYSQPFVGLFLDWSAWGRTNIAWIAARPELPLRWGELYGVDLFGLAPAEHYQYSPGLGSLAHTDLASPLFWQRDADCSSTSAWKIIWGWYQTQGEPVRSAFLNDPAAVSAVDAISPGQLAWWLVDRGYATPTR